MGKNISAGDSAVYSLQCYAACCPVSGQKKCEILKCILRQVNESCDKIQGENGYFGSDGRMWAGCRKTSFSGATLASQLEIIQPQINTFTLLPSG
jgi:hypothetical protein